MDELNKTYSMADKRASAQLFTLTDVLAGIDAWRMEHLSRATRVRLSPAIYERLHQEMHVAPQGHLTIHTIFGLKVLVDPTLKHGEWRLEGSQESEG